LKGAIVARGNSGRYTAPLAIALLAVYTLVFFYRVLPGGCFVASDFHLTFEPLRAVLSEAFDRGLPLWNDRLGNGTPLLANPMHAALYLPNLLFAPFPGARTLTLLTVGHLLFGSCGAWLLSRRLGSGRSGSWVAAVVFGFGGAAVSATSFTNLSWSVAWLPWLLLATGRAWDDRFGIASVLPLAVVVGAMLALGDPFILLAGACGIALWVLAAVGGSFRETFVPAAKVTTGVAVGLAMASPLLLAAARYFPASVRAVGFTPEGATSWSFHPALAINLVVPSPFGDPGAIGLDRFWAVALLPERAAPLLIGFYVGGLVLCLALLGLAEPGRQRWLLGLWLGVLVLLALGRHGPIYPLIDEMAPVAALRYPMKWMLPAMLPLALIAGRGTDMVARTASHRRVRRVFLTILLIAMVGIALLAVLSTPQFDAWLRDLAGSSAGEQTGVHIGPDRFDDMRSTFSTAVTWAAVPLLLAAVAALWSRRKTSRASLGPFVAILVTADLLLHNPRLAPAVDREFYRRVPEAIRIVLEDDVAGRVFVDPAPADLEFVQPASSVQDVSAWQRAMLRGYTPASFGIPLALNTDTEDFGPMRSKRLQVLVHGAPLREKLMLLGAAGVTHVVSHRPWHHRSLEPLAAIAGPADRPQRVFRNRLALPRVRIVPTLLPYGDDAGFIRAVERGPDDLFGRVALAAREDLAEAGPSFGRLPPPRLTGPPAAAGTARLVEDGVSTLVIHVDGSGGFAVLSDSFVPGWTAEVDGQRVDIVPVDIAFRAVAVPPGTHSVVFRYRPW
jgi:hypothetical protein